MDTVKIEGKEYEIKSRDHNGTPIIQGYATSIHHTDKDGKPVFDKDGNPKVSVHISASPIQEIITPGKVE